MKRRSFLAMLGLAPLGAVAAVKASEAAASFVFEGGAMKVRAIYLKDISAATGPASAIVRRVDALQPYPAELVCAIRASTDARIASFKMYEDGRMRLCASTVEMPAIGTQSG